MSSFKRELTDRVGRYPDEQELQSSAKDFLRTTIEQKYS